MEPCPFCLDARSHRHSVAIHEGVTMVDGVRWKPPVTEEKPKPTRAATAEEIENSTRPAHRKERDR